MRDWRCPERGQRERSLGGYLSGSTHAPTGRGTPEHLAHRMVEKVQPYGSSGMEYILAFIVFGALIAICACGLVSSFRASREIDRGRPHERPMAGVSGE